MDARQIHLIQSTFAQLEQESEPLTDLLYARLFQLDPSLRALFPNDLQADKQKFLRVLTFVVNHLDQPDEWLPRVEDLGRWHRAQGIEPRHYETLGSALIWTLDKALGEEFGFQVLDAWVAFYTRLAQTMQQAARDREIQQEYSQEENKMNPKKFLVTFVFTLTIAAAMLATALQTQASSAPPRETASQLRPPAAITPQCFELPNAPTLLSPPNNSLVLSQRVTLKWSVSKCAAFYRVQIKKDSVRSVPFLTTDVYSGPSYKTPTLASQHKYYWRVKACNFKGCAASGWASFTVW